MWKLVMLPIIMALMTTMFGANYFISTTGSDSNDGTIGSPFLTIQHCTGLVVAGDTCNVRTGTYNLRPSGPYNPIWLGNGHSADGTSGNVITLKAYNHEVVAIQQNGYDTIIQLDGVSYWTVEDVILDGSTGPGFRACNASIGALIAGRGEHFIVQNSEIKNGVSHGILAESTTEFKVLNVNVHDNGTLAFINCDMISIQMHGVYWYGKYLLIDGGSYHDNAGFGVHIYSSGQNDLGHNTVRNARVYENNPYPDGNGGGVILSSGPENLAYNNLIYLNTGTGIQISGGCGLTGAACQALNNTIYGNDGKGVFITTGDTTGAVLKNNILYANTGAAYTDDGIASVISNNLTTDPSFTNVGSADFTITSGSAARSYGVNVTPLGITGLLTDLDGHARPNAAADAGAYQYFSAGMSGAGPGRLRFH